MHTNKSNMTNKKPIKIHIANQYDNNDNNNDIDIQNHVHGLLPGKFQNLPCARASCFARIMLHIKRIKAAWAENAFLDKNSR